MNATKSVRTRTLRILCDVDGVLADFVGLILDYVQKNTGLSYRPEAVDQWDMLQCLGLGDHWTYFRTQCDELALCRTMRPLPGARAFYAELEQIAGAANVRVCTTPMTPAWLTQRAEWLVEFGVPFERQIQIRDKHELAREDLVLIDDKAENCTAFVKAGGRAFCVATPYNTHLAELHYGNDVPRGTHAECLAWLRGL
jgi:5'(3')-deoxyribonucleotidase